MRVRSTRVRQAAG